METVAAAVLQEHGYDPNVIKEALRLHGSRIADCVEYCLGATSQGDRAGTDADGHGKPASSKPTQTGVDDMGQTGIDEDSAFVAMRELGFADDVVKAMLEACEFSAPAALKTLLLGRDLERARHVRDSCFQRQAALKTLGAASVSRLCDMSVREQYETRSQEDLQFHADIVDLGQHAGGTTGACFWLSLAAGLSRTGWTIPIQSDAFADVSPTLLRRVSEMSVTDMNVGCRSRALDSSPVGELAVRLRHSFCAGPSALLLQPRVLQTVFPAFALIAHRADRASMSSYKKWVGRLACTEYADELVVHVVARELGITIRVVPYTPRTAVAPWRISEYTSPLPVEGQRQCVTLGNNDVHYVWLSAHE